MSLRRMALMQKENPAKGSRGANFLLIFLAGCQRFFLFFGQYGCIVLQGHPWEGFQPRFRRRGFQPRPFAEKWRTV